MALILWILAVFLVISGIVAIVRKQILWGLVLIISDHVHRRAMIRTCGWALGLVT